MDEQVKYGILHEVGEYADFKPLNEADNSMVNDRDSKDTNNDDSQQN